ncbi:cupin domain-containing protein [Falsiroseomonas tokyonensis]|uniref:5-deoxy-glucuronate isomerase n=1 Tax=Falsiroseomonas tokyonensis TaxID=430521 RepID=A0ABV7BT33_9PROT|nr:hypothetical protein [Falsiroseomonas tokyonensis]MBU8537247.1 hypothetical protein [Falsiroseomonas tokyonensis]
MAYHASDPRAALAPASGAKPTEGPYAPADYAKFYETQPQLQADGARTWLVRGRNFVVVYSEVEDGAVLSRQGQPDEYVLLLPDPGLSATITAGGETKTVEGHSLAFIPPGDSRITLQGKGRITRLFTPRAEDLAAQCSNAANYLQPDPRIPPIQDWPTPPDGFRIRSYTLDVPKTPGRFGRIWRCTTFMVNYLDPAAGPRDIRKLSPHHHDDFEQCSLVLNGSYTHHIRWPWTPDQTHWREDEHELCGAPSVTVIPPPSIHTSRAEEAGQMVDIFCPPRVDFSNKPGWVLNADDYPMPKG